ncbi:MAG: sensor histidine kinase [Lawsonibacter sp.]|nr:sensor histidine kinase [Lawsonibacter sp.]
MKKHILLFSNLIIIFSIVVGFIGVVYKDTTAYQDLAEKHMGNILSLADNDISSHIEDAMAKPVMVSKTMANDEFLKRWLIEESEDAENDTYLNQLYSYLKTYQEKYGYTTVFCISAQTGNYYYQDGLNKTISSNDVHDIWYYNFTESGHEYDLEVDTNQTNNNFITVFVNFRVESGDGKLLGVIGVGLQVDTLEGTIREYEEDYGLSVYIINAGGSKNSFTGDTNLFIGEDDLPKRTGITEKIRLNQSEVPELQWHTTEGERKCLITKYNEALGWYLVMEMDTSSISSVFQANIKNNVFFMLAALASKIYDTVQVVEIVLAFACFIVIFFLLFSSKFKYISRLQNEMEIIGSGNLDLQVTIKGHDEIGFLALGIDEMRKSFLERIKNENEAKRANSELITSISHDLRTPLTILIGNLDVITNKKYKNEEQLERYLGNCKKKAYQLKELSDKLFEYFLVFGSEFQEPRLELIDGQELLIQLIEEYSLSLKDQGFEVKILSDVERCLIEANMIAVRRVFDNLFGNIQKYAASGSRIEIIMSSKDLVLSVCIKNKIKESFFNVSSTNIGLATCEKIMAQHAGACFVVKTPDEFCVTVRFPIKQIST